MRPQARGNAGPLSGVRVLELGTLIAGPFATRLLADLGAEVIKIEAPDKPDPMRDWGQGRYRGRSLWWPLQSRGKKLVTLNLREREGQELLLRLVQRSDALVENFRPGTLEKWKLGFEALSAANPGIILARVSGYGQTGPYAGRAGFAAAAEAMGGLRYLNGYPGQAPPRAGLSLGDSLAALFTVHGVLAALYNRDALGGGRGQVVDVSLMESCFALLESIVPEYDRLGAVRQPSGTRLKGNAPSNLFRSRDGRWVVIAANQDDLFRRLCQAMGRPELVTDARFSTHTVRGENQEEIERIVADWAGQLDASEIDLTLNAAGVVAAPVYTVADIFEDPQFRHREMLVEMEDPELGRYVGPGVLPKFSETTPSIPWSGRWELGADNSEVYCSLLGLTEDQLQDLESRGVL
jgi:succinyl-CoA---D-citramalate CoA-transferase